MNKIRTNFFFSMSRTSYIRSNYNFCVSIFAHFSMHTLKTTSFFSVFIKSLGMNERVKRKPYFMIQKMWGVYRYNSAVLPHGHKFVIYDD